jgi:phage-related minor tail protein
MLVTERMRAIRDELRRLAAGERTEEAAAEAKQLLVEYGREQLAAGRPEPTAEERAAAERAEEDRRWRKVMAKRGGGGMSRVISPWR